MNAILNYFPLAGEGLLPFGQNLWPPSSSRQAASKSIEEDKIPRLGIKAKRRTRRDF